MVKKAMTMMITSLLAVDDENGDDGDNNDDDNDNDNDDNYDDDADDDDQDGHLPPRCLGHILPCFHSAGWQVPSSSL